MQIGDKWTVSDDLVRGFYECCERDGIAKTVFFDGTISSSDELLAAVQAPHNIVCFFFQRGYAVPVAFAWLNALGGHTAFAHFCILKCAWGDTARELGRMAINHWLSFPGPDGPLIHLILGTIPAFNRRAVGYVKSIGFRSYGQIPKLVKGRSGLSAGELVYYVRD